MKLRNIHSKYQFFNVFTQTVEFKELDESVDCAFCCDCVVCCEFCGFCGCFSSSISKRVKFTKQFGISSVKKIMKNKRNEMR